MELENERRQSTAQLANASNIPLTINDNNNNNNASKNPSSKLLNTPIVTTQNASQDTHPDKSSKLLPEKELEASPINQISEKKTDESNSNKETDEEKLSAPKIESFAAAMSSTNTADVGSRFYIKRRIIIGNVSKYIAPGKDYKCQKMSLFTHHFLQQIVEIHF